MHTNRYFAFYKVSNLPRNKIPKSSKSVINHIHTFGDSFRLLSFHYKNHDDKFKIDMKFLHA